MSKFIGTLGKGLATILSRKSKNPLSSHLPVRQPRFTSGKNPQEESKTTTDTFVEPRDDQDPSNIVNHGVVDREMWKHYSDPAKSNSR